MLQSVIEALSSSQLPKKMRSLVVRSWGVRGDGGLAVAVDAATNEEDMHDVRRMQLLMGRSTMLKYVSLTVGGFHWDSFDLGQCGSPLR